MKVYAIIFDYQGYEESVIGVFSTCEKAKGYLIKEFNECKYTDKKMFLDDSEYSLVEWELDTNKQRRVEIHL